MQLYLFYIVLQWSSFSLSVLFNINCYYYYASMTIPVGACEVNIYLKNLAQPMCSPLRKAIIGLAVQKSIRSFCRLYRWSWSVWHGDRWVLPRATFYPYHLAIFPASSLQNAFPNKPPLIMERKCMQYFTHRPYDPEYTPSTKWCLLENSQEYTIDNT